MEMTDRPHRCSSTTNNNASATGGELFICFTSRLSSSMKLPSKSILSPARTAATRDSSQISLSTSLSRRLRPSGSLRAGQASPMFPPTSTAGKKRGCGFDNPEPTSPKVTCIGQVRVKTKGKRILPRSKPRPAEVSFRKIDPNNLDMAHLHHQSHQECRKWVHLPVTICEALRAIGTEFNCFLPCRSSCMANHRDKQEKASSDAGSGGGNGGGGGSSCGAVLARWLVAAVQEGEGQGRGRQIELVVGEEEEEEDIIRSSHRRHVFEDIEINLCDDEKEKEQGRVSICIPPKNALLLMRCRSDPVKMAALANRSSEPPLPKREHCVMEEDEEEEEEDEDKASYLRKREKQEPEIEERECKELSSCEKLLPFEAVEQLNLNQKDVEARSTLDEDFPQGLENPELEGNGLEEETTAHESAAEAGGQDVEITAAGESFLAQGMQQVDTAHESPAEGAPFVEADVSGSVQENGSDQVEVEQTAEPEPEPEPESASAPHSDDTLEETIMEEEFVEAENEEASPASEVHEETGETETGTKENGRAAEPPDPEENGPKQEEKLLPDCLLLMMCEPKLSMEVSKETWVCSRDFIRWQPEKQRAVKVKRKDGPDEDESKRRISVDRKPVLPQPPRSSVSFPVAAPVGAGGGGSIARIIEQKLVGGGKGCEPFVLTRCKSEPLRSAAKLSADSCFWKNRKLEPATLGVGAAGVGF